MDSPFKFRWFGAVVAPNHINSYGVGPGHIGPEGGSWWTGMSAPTLPHRAQILT